MVSSRNYPRYAPTCELRNEQSVFGQSEHDWRAVRVSGSGEGVTPPLGTSKSPVVVFVSNEVEPPGLLESVEVEMGVVVVSPFDGDRPPTHCSSAILRDWSISLGKRQFSSIICSSICGLTTDHCRWGYCVPSWECRGGSVG